MTEEITYEVGSGNVYQDLGFPDADEMLLKSQLAYKISTIIKSRRLTQAQAAEIMQIDQPKVSAIIRGRLSGFSIERLFYFLRLLGHDIDIYVHPKGRKQSIGCVQIISGRAKKPTAAKAYRAV